jgi:chemotaxis protein MotB
VAPPLAKDSRDIEVDGYTNQQNVSTDPYPSGWELSSARASAVVRFLTAHGVSEDKLSAVGYSDQHPLYPATDPRSITLNRRVEIVVLSNLAAPTTDSSAATPAGAASPATNPSPTAAASPTSGSSPAAH